MSIYIGQPLYAKRDTDGEITENALTLKDHQIQKFAPEHMQYALDAKGKKKFHGAFTGGFVAGFNNTVGSKEGFVPKSFKMSRSQQQADKQSLGLEDIMDDEDRNDVFGRETLATKREFSQQGAEAFLDHLFDGTASSVTKSSHQGNLEQLLLGKGSHMNEQIGYRLLKKMGWQQGQVIGNKGKDDQLVHVEHLLVKLDSSGIGYVKKHDMAEDEQEYALKAPAMDTNKLSVSDLFKQRAKYEDMDEYDIEISANESYHEDVWNKRALSKKPNAETTYKSQKQATTTISNLDKSVVDGFHVSKQPLYATSTSAKYPLPQVPKDFVPMHISTATSNPNATKTLITSIEERGKMLGEEVLPSTASKPPSVEQPKEEEQQLTMQDVDRLRSKPLFNTSDDIQNRLSQHLQSRFVSGTKQDLNAQQQDKKQGGFVEGKSLEQEQPKQAPTVNASIAANRNIPTLGRRRIISWIPDALLCKRFGVVPPQGNAKTAPSSSQQQQQQQKAPTIVAGSIFDNTLFQRTTSVTQQEKLEQQEKKQDDESFVQQAATVPVNVATAELEQERPSMDVFKAIFEDDDDEKSNVEENTPPAIESNAVPSIEAPVTKQQQVDEEEMPMQEEDDSFPFKKKNAPVEVKPVMQQQSKPTPVDPLTAPRNPIFLPERPPPSQLQDYLSSPERNDDEKPNESLEDMQRKIKELEKALKKKKKREKREKKKRKHSSSDDDTSEEERERKRKKRHK